MGYFRLLFTVARYSSLLSVVLEMPFSEVQCCSFVEYFFNGVGKRCVGWFYWKCVLFHIVESVFTKWHVVN